MCDKRATTISVSVGLFLLAAVVSEAKFFERAGSSPLRDSGAEETWIEEIEVAHYKRPCKRLITAFCLVSRKSEAHPWEVQEWIDGFTPVWGLCVRLRVQVRKLANPPADGPSLEYHLKEVLSTTPVPPGTQFELVFGPGWAQELITGGSKALSLKGERRLVCADSRVCAELTRRRLSGRGFRLMLRHPNNLKDPLLVISLADWP